MSKITSVESYTQQEVLLLSQILYVNDLRTDKQIASASDSLISSILSEFKNHAVMKLENKSIKLNTKSQLKELYGNLLKKYEVKNTEELANATYYGRMEELDKQIETYKHEFQKILNE